MVARFVSVVVADFENGNNRVIPVLVHAKDQPPFFVEADGPLPLTIPLELLIVKTLPVPQIALICRPAQEVDLPARRLDDRH